MKAPRGSLPPLALLLLGAGAVVLIGIGAPAPGAPAAGAAPPVRPAAPAGPQGPQGKEGQAGFRNPPAPLDMAGEAMGGAQGPFFPSSLHTRGGKTIPLQLLIEQKSCGQAGCHADVVRQWQSSSHALSSYESPWYRRSFAALQAARGVAASRWCAGCHSPALLASGGMDRPLAPEDDSAAARAGVTCAACHLIAAVGSTMGQADFELAVPAEHEQLSSADPRVRAEAAARIRAHPEEHRRTYLKPFFRGPLSGAYCSTCHKSHLDAPVNGARWLPELDDYDAWQASSFSGFGARSYYEPETPQTCAGCHMPLVRSQDAGNRQGFIHSHRFAAANSALPALRGDQEQERAVADFLRGKVTVDIFGISEAIAEPSGAAAPPDTAARAMAVFAPLNRLPATVRRGESRRIDVLVRSHAVGHLFPGGKGDLHDCWVELEAADESGRVLFWSGRAGETSAVDEGAHAYRWYLVDDHGNPVDKHNVWDGREDVYARDVLPNTADVVHYRLQIPPTAGKTITLTARLNYRKFAWPFTQWVFAGAPSIPRQPIVVMAEDRVTLAVVAADAALPDMTRPRLLPAVDRNRFFDYAIGLYFHRDLIGAERAARQVTELAPQAVDGWANLGQIELAAADLVKARTYLDRALQVDPGSTRAHALYGQLEKAAGNDAKALEHLRPVAARRPEDRLVLNEIASVLAHQGDLAGAAAVYERVLEIDPEFRPAHFGLMQAYRKLGDDQRASLHQKLYERFAPMEQKVVDEHYLAAHPNQNRERQIRHVHVSGPLAPGGDSAPAKADAD